MFILSIYLSYLFIYNRKKQILVEYLTSYLYIHMKLKLYGIFDPTFHSNQ